MEAGFNRKYKKYGLTSTQFDILIYLLEETDREITLSDIAAHFGVRHTIVIHVLKLLEQKGLICKTKVQSGRAKPILLTESGRQLGRQLISEMQQTAPLLNEIMFAGLSEDDQKALEKMLRQIYENLQADAFKNM